jgi:hypothetical protein
MDVTRIRALRGPNLWSRCTALEAIVRCEGDGSSACANCSLPWAPFAASPPNTTWPGHACSNAWR